MFAIDSSSAAPVWSAQTLIAARLFHSVSLAPGASKARISGEGCIMFMLHS